MNHTLITIQVEAWFVYLLLVMSLISFYFSAATIYYRRKLARLETRSNKLLSEMKEKIEERVAKEIIASKKKAVKKSTKKA